ncbi:MAG: hypothetical protein QM594_16400 [Niabella sp.]
MKERIAVETLTLGEISDIFQESIEIANPKFNRVLEKELKRQKKVKITKLKWIKSYEEFKGAKLNFYCEKIPAQENPIVAIGMTYRTTKGLMLVTVDTSNGGVPTSGFMRNTGWNKWVRIYTEHFCERFAERILNAEKATFQVGSEGIMFSDMLGPVRVTDTVTDNLEEIEFQFKEGQAYGYRDSKSKITFFRTVYSNDMLKRERLDFKNEWEQPLDELYELFKWE